MTDALQGLNLVTLLKRLDAATTRLEDITIFQESIIQREQPFPSEILNNSESQSVQQGSSRLDSSASDFTETKIEAEKPSITAYEKLYNDHVAPFLALSKELDETLGKQVQFFANAFQEQLKLLKAVVRSRKVEITDSTFLEAVKPTNTLLREVFAIKDDNRRSEFFDNLNSVAEGAPVLGWLYVNTPVSYIPEYKDAASFWTNKVLKKFRDTDSRQVEWVKQFLGIFDALRDYAKEYHTTGASWDANGTEFKEALKSSGSPTNAPLASASAPVAGGPPPPPPPPPADVFQTDDSKGKKPQGMGAVFADLNKGEAITSGLRKVDKSEMVHKNPELRQSNVVPANKEKPGKPQPPKKPSGLSTKKPARKELQDNKWLVENYDGEQEIVIEGEMQQSVFISKCDNSTITIRGKVAAVSLTQCSKVGLVVDSLVSGIDVIKSRGFGVQVLGNVPTITIDQSDNGQIYLGAESLGTEIYASSTTSLNINVPDEDGDFREMAAPEQFKHTVAGGNLQTTVVEHVG
ncbi:Adenylyl cyclase-associated protein [Komagataella phaffii CBS 7435]|uniref:Adenylyl cyclase-associated protein n=2 Tax=Komagataella phaffii TaxID=460519 RepID=C4R2Z1_KOMPG|nr:CAP (cyclase-associated protein) subunit of adenylyl cyclase complex [Komagataella phaffii GS115]AOA62725.1 GQ67_01282T0 [Komagataella phaffii]CAH2447578.1 Adenylyl cyclase-associated protein [Komagataella phaffii CBS 7435]AOA66988.1 GQ68_00108T0 [Komagataella phaffii GS115]CAY69865.1 CAP (cyclase-associated protein) subunit of adenylyl cyclase complex [Komagataella phaffii GS115]CCA37769.1 Adenylyl cyclase-associated protein [Komagataella phaffii CBS 7435]